MIKGNGQIQRILKPFIDNVLSLELLGDAEEFRWEVPSTDFLPGGAQVGLERIDILRAEVGQDMPLDVSPDELHRVELEITKFRGRPSLAAMRRGDRTGSSGLSPALLFDCRSPKPPEFGGPGRLGSRHDLRTLVR